jgi:hypothetical protein
MTIATDSAINFANGVLELQETIEKHQRMLFELGVTNERLVERLDSVEKHLIKLKSMLRGQRGMRYDDYNPIAAHLDYTMAVVQGRAPIKETA